MPKTLRRPMFRGGPVNSEGTGITSGLDQGYETGGRVGFKEGEGLFDFFSPEVVSEDEAQQRINEKTLYPFQKRNPEEVLPFIPAGRLAGIGQGALKTYGKYPQVLDQFKRYITKKEVPDFIAGPKGVSPYQAPGFGTNAAIKEAIAPYLSGAKELAMSGLSKVKDYGLGLTGVGGLGYGIYKGLGGGEGGDNKNKPEVAKGETEVDKLNKIIEEMKITHEKELAKLKGTGVPVSEESDISQWAKEARDLLGYDEAKKQSIYDALLAASPGFFKGRNLREAAPNILESINKSGAFDKPTNIKQAAAQLAIQRKMMQEKAIAEEKTRYGVLEAREGFKSKNPIERLVAYKFDPSQVFEGPVPADQRLWKVGKVYIDSAGKLGIGKKDEITKLVKIVSLE
jgi:hypothetical protein